MVQNENLRKIPAVDKLLNDSEIKELIKNKGINLVKFAIRKAIDDARSKMLRGEVVSSQEEIICIIKDIVQSISTPSLLSVLNGSGIILHTNLGRAPLGKVLLDEVSEVLKGYSNLEFNLDKGARGERNAHAAPIIRYLTGAEDVIVVNNNAAAVMFLLTAFGRGKESIVSRGELIEIGGSFRIPDIMETSGSKMVEVGATNKTKVADYEKVINENSAILFKAHRSNYVIKGFTEEVSISELAELGKKHNVISIYDIGSGLLRKVDNNALKDEPDVREAIDAGVDIVCFSGDKLLGGGQAGIIAGKKKYIDILKKHPMLRALRVCKTTLAILETACSYYLDDEKLFKNNILFSTLAKKEDTIKNSAYLLTKALLDLGINSEISQSEGLYGGGTLPDLKLNSYQVKIDISKLLKKDKNCGKTIFDQLLLTEKPLLTNLKSGNVYIDMLCVDDSDILTIANCVKNVIDKI